jgi:L-asparaginase
MARYDTGFHLKNAGVISGYDGTVESAVAKLMYLQGNFTDPEKIRYYLDKNLRGEITI